MRKVYADLNSYDNSPAPGYVLSLYCFISKHSSLLILSTFTTHMYVIVSYLKAIKVEWPQIEHRENSCLISYLYAPFLLRQSLFDLHKNSNKNIVVFKLLQIVMLQGNKLKDKCRQ